MPEEKKIIVSKSTAISVGLLIPILSALTWIFNLKGQVEVNAQVISETQRAYLETAKAVGEINTRLSRIEGYLDGKKETGNSSPSSADHRVKK